MSLKITERQLRNKVLKKLKDKGWLVISLSDKWRSGTPDLFCAKNGKAIFIELKSPTGKLSRIQEATIHAIQSAGIMCYVINDIKQIELI